MKYLSLRIESPGGLRATARCDHFPPHPWLKVSVDPSNGVVVNKAISLDEWIKEDLRR
jgi:hypothetical protein